MSDRLVGQDMFEFDKYDPSAMREASSPATPYSPFAGATRRAFLLWGEHCIECAAPDCFSSCDLYQPWTKDESQ